MWRRHARHEKASRWPQRPHPPSSASPPSRPSPRRPLGRVQILRAVLPPDLRSTCSPAPAARAGLRRATRERRRRARGGGRVRNAAAGRLRRGRRAPRLSRLSSCRRRRGCRTKRLLAAGARPRAAGRRLLPPPDHGRRRRRALAPALAERAHSKASSCSSWSRTMRAERRGGAALLREVELLRGPVAGTSSTCSRPAIATARSRRSTWRAASCASPPTARPITSTRAARGAAAGDVRLPRRRLTVRRFCTRAALPPRGRCDGAAVGARARRQSTASWRSPSRTKMRSSRPPPPAPTRRPPPARGRRCSSATRRAGRRCRSRARTRAASRRRCGSTATRRWRSTPPTSRRWSTLSRRLWVLRAADGDQARLPRRRDARREARGQLSLASCGYDVAKPRALARGVARPTRSRGRRIGWPASATSPTRRPCFAASP